MPYIIKANPRFSDSDATEYTGNFSTFGGKTTTDVNEAEVFHDLEQAKKMANSIINDEVVEVDITLASSNFHPQDPNDPTKQTINAKQLFDWLCSADSQYFIDGEFAEFLSGGESAPDREAMMERIRNIIIRQNIC